LITQQSARQSLGSFAIRSIPILGMMIELHLVRVGSG
jgi:hypothetical protein